MVRKRPSCHSYFAANYFVLSLPIPILQYLVSHTPKADRKPLREVRHASLRFSGPSSVDDQVFDLLVDASQGVEVELLKAKAIFLYLGLFTMVVIKPIQ